MAIPAQYKVLPTVFQGKEEEKNYHRMLPDTEFKVNLKVPLTPGKIFWNFCGKLKEL